MFAQGCTSCSRYLLSATLSQPAHPHNRQAVVPAAAAASDEGADLSCLDHSYMLGEVSRLTSRASALQARLYRDNMNCGRRGGADAERALDGLAEVLARLESYSMGLGGEHPAPFDAGSLLQGESAGSCSWHLFCCNSNVCARAAGNCRTGLQRPPGLIRHRVLTAL